MEVSIIGPFIVQKVLKTRPLYEITAVTNGYAGEK